MPTASRFSCYAHTLGDPFDDSVIADETGVAKPNPEFFAYQSSGRQSAFGYKQSDILHVAQSQHHDIGIARKLGYKSVLDRAPPGHGRVSAARPKCPN